MEKNDIRNWLLDNRFVTPEHATNEQAENTLQWAITIIHTYNADLLAKVSEQEKEIERLKVVKDECIKSYEKQLFDYRQEVSEQSQKIEALTKENEDLKYERPLLIKRIEILEEKNKRQAELIERCIHPDRLPEVVSRLREERKELVEALRESSKMLPAYIAGTADINPASEELFYKIQSLLSKFEVPNQS